jgi:uncharacterized tellurite resistance protein B-like protein
MALEYPFELPATLFHSIGMPISTKIDEPTLELFAKTLMVVVGSDNRLSMWERGWLKAFLTAYGASNTLLDQLDDFDYKGSQIEDFLPTLLEGDYSTWVKRSLLQGAIRMAKADTVSKEEAASIHKVGEMLGMSADAVGEVMSLVEMFDSVTGTNTVLLSIAQKEDAEELVRTRESRIVTVDAWDDEADPADLPEDNDLMQVSMKTFAKALLYVAAADGIVSQEEMDFFRVYMKTWGASDEQIEAMLQTDPSDLTPEDIVAQSYSLSWGLKALTSVALRTAGADGLAQEEENAILRLYELTGRSIMHYFAAKGLEEIREKTLKRLNEIFAKYL